MIDVHVRIEQLLAERGWTKYELAKRADLHNSTLNNLFTRNYSPTVPTLEAICKGFGISMAQFFAEGELVELNAEQKELFDQWLTLSAEQKQALYDLIKSMKS